MASRLLRKYRNSRLGAAVALVVGGCLLNPQPEDSGDRNLSSGGGSKGVHSDTTAEDESPTGNGVGATASAPPDVGAGGQLAVVGVGGAASSLDTSASNEGSSGAASQVGGFAGMAGVFGSAGVRSAAYAGTSSVTR